MTMQTTLHSTAVPNYTFKERYYAAIDLGSNTCRLLIAKKFADSFSTQEVYSRIVRLGEGLSKHNHLSKEAIQRTLSVLSQYAKKIREYTPIEVVAVATEACRKAKNSEDFLNLVSQETGLEFSIISGKEEAFYVAKGCTALVNPRIPYAIFFDIGGGSTEIIWAHIKENCEAEILSWTSLPYGVVNLAESHDVNRASVYHSIHRQVYELALNFVQKNNIATHIENNKVQMISTSGTATTVSAIHLGLRSYDRQKVDRSFLSFEDIEMITKQLQLMAPQERDIHPCIGPERSDLILGGMAILGGLCEALPIGSLQVADRGVRDGIVAYMAYGNQPAPDHRLSLDSSSAA